LSGIDLTLHKRAKNTIQVHMIWSKSGLAIIKLSGCPKHWDKTLLQIIIKENIPKGLEYLWKYKRVQRVLYPNND